MKEHAKGLAERHEIDPRPIRTCSCRDWMRTRQILLHVNGLLTDAVASNLRIAPASEWLLDNFYKIEEQIRMARLHLPRIIARIFRICLTGRWPGIRESMALPQSCYSIPMAGWMQNA